MGAPSAALVCAPCVVVILSWLLLKYVKWVWLEPKKLERLLKDQGIKGSPYKFLMGDLRDNARLMREARSRPIPLTHDIVPRVTPLHHQLMKTHGKMCITWFGPIPRVTIMDPELVKEILSNKFGHFARPNSNPVMRLLGSGLVSYDGEKWAKHRRIINPAFHQEKLKLMMPAFSSSCVELIDRWKKLVDSSGEEHCELDVWPELQNLTGDVISRTAFGSSYEEGRRIFQLQHELAELIMEIIQFLPIPGYRFLPTKRNIKIRNIDKEIHIILGDLVSKRIKAMKMGDVYNDDLLGILIESNFKLDQEQDSKSLAMTVDEVIEECKLFYLAGQETTTSILTWTVILLSIHPDWQSRARQEVLEVFGDNKPDYDGLHHLKIVTMILYEVLRLYPPVVFLVRCTYKEMKLGKVTFHREFT
ncbi:Secologanin synthase [Acorus calamus]|uniref:Secologanin synthase n=1 Tax=Acorus calamus TaxID=4465 RepID=A0AAV9DB64_ACOCL|nr:Secologanin synthase [Acorus calamus]